MFRYMMPVFMLSCLLQQAALADMFGSGENQFEIEFVTIGDPGNAPDESPNPAGAVDYVYRMGKSEVSEAMIDAANISGNLGITQDSRGPNKPATSITWFEAAKFVNWLNESSGHMPAYKFDEQGSFQLWEESDAGYDPDNLYRNKRTRYVLPSVDEWHKAAFYDPLVDHYWNYPTGSDEVPDGIDFVGDPDFDAVFFDGANPLGPNDVMDVGLLSPFGTRAQGGNVYEWSETAFVRQNALANDQRITIGGTWGSSVNVLSSAHTGGADIPTLEAPELGFRVVSIPEPSTATSFVALILVHWTLTRSQACRCIIDIN